MSFEIPTTIKDSERIVRIVFSPYHVRQKADKWVVKNNAFHAPPNIDEISVTRLDYSSINLCREQGKKMGQIALEKGQSKAYQGLIHLTCLEIKEAGAFLRATPIILDNPAHADIYYKFVKTKGEPYPAEINLIIQKLKQRAVFYKDPNPSSENWEGDEIV